MDREAFLQQPDIQGFVIWMGKNLPSLSIDLRFARSKYVRKPLREKVTGIEGAQRAYQWDGCWDDVSKTLKAFRERLRDASLAGNSTAAYTVCEEILKWGGVLNPASVTFLQGLATSEGLPGYLMDVEALLRLDSNNRISQITRNSMPVFNSGMTKIHAIYDESGSPILDGRVAGAAATLYHLYRSDACHQTASMSNHLIFAWDEGPGIQVRNPQMLDPRYVGIQRLNRGKPHEWAVRQLQLGWIIRYLLETHVEIFPRLGIEERCHRFEAGLFMMGYDLRSIIPEGWNIPEPPALARKRTSQADWRKRKRAANALRDEPIISEQQY